MAQYATANAARSTSGFFAGISLALMVGLYLRVGSAIVRGYAQSRRPFLHLYDTQIGKASVSLLPMFLALCCHRQRLRLLCPLARRDLCRVLQSRHTNR